MHFIKKKCLPFAKHRFSDQSVYIRVGICIYFYENLAYERLMTWAVF